MPDLDVRKHVLYLIRFCSCITRTFKAALPCICLTREYDPCFLLHMRGTSQSALEYSLLLKKLPTVNKKF